MKKLIAALLVGGLFSVGCGQDTGPKGTPPKGGTPPAGDTGRGVPKPPRGEGAKPEPTKDEGNKPEPPKDDSKKNEPKKDAK